MNERMAELFGQAGISDSINEEFGIEYLAELIVRECIGLCNRLETCYAGDLNMTPNEVAKDTAESCAEIIGEHFGVK